jgi:hypothetical protein
MFKEELDSLQFEIDTIAGPFLDTKSPGSHYTVSLKCGCWFDFNIKTDENGGKSGSVEDTYLVCKRHADSNIQHLHSHKPHQIHWAKYVRAKLSGKQIMPNYKLDDLTNMMRNNLKLSVRSVLPSMHSDPQTRELAALFDSM